MGVPAVHHIVFRKQLAKEMMYNKLTETGGIRHFPIRERKRSRESLDMEHKLMTKPTYTGSWEETVKCFKEVSTEYLKQKCYSCSRKIRTYCSCDKGTPMCSVCYGVHMHDVHNTN
jgi:hypothetical protein